MIDRGHGAEIVHIDHAVAGQRFEHTGAHDADIHQTGLHGIDDLALVPAREQRAGRDIVDIQPVLAKLLQRELPAGHFIGRHPHDAATRDIRDGANIAVSGGEDDDAGFIIDLSLPHLGDREQRAGVAFDLCHDKGRGIDKEEIQRALRDFIDHCGVGVRRDLETVVQFCALCGGVQRGGHWQPAVQRAGDPFGGENTDGDVTGRIHRVGLLTSRRLQCTDQGDSGTQKRSTQLAPSLFHDFSARHILFLVHLVALRTPESIVKARLLLSNITTSNHL